MALLIRDITPADAAGVIAVLNPIIEARVYTALDAPFSLADERDFIAAFPERGVWKVAVRATDHRLVGFQILEPFGPYTRAFDHVGTLGTFVDLNERRQGIATRLFAATFAAARQKGYEKIFTFVRADNPAAQAVYQRAGFETIGTARRHARIDGRYIDEVLIEKFLADTAQA